MVKEIINSPELLISVLAVLTAFAAVFVGAIGLAIQRSHNKKSVLPICSIRKANYDNEILLSIENTGIGPLIITKISMLRNGTNEMKENQYPIDLMPEGIMWNTFRKGLENHSILPNSEIVLLEFVPQTFGDNDVLENIRKILSECSIKIDFKDVYGKKRTSIDNLIWYRK